MTSALPQWLTLTYIALLGACLGSFMNVVIARLPEGESVVRPRSRCPKCKKQIAWYDNLPIISWLALRGRCRTCKTSISPRYMLVELLMALVALALALRLGVSLELALWLPLAAGLLAIVFLDIDHFWVPDVIVFPCMGAAALLVLLPDGLSIQDALWGLGPALGLWLFAFTFEKITGKEGMGFGDIKLLALIGLLVGAMPALVVLFLAALQGSVIGILVLARGGHKAKPEKLPQDDGWEPHPHAIPFGPFLILALFEVVLLPDTFGNLPSLVSRLVAPS